MINSKYEDIQFQDETVIHEIHRLINQIWKLIPMRENKENWTSQLESVLTEVTGLNEIINELDLLEILSILEGLNQRRSLVPFMNFRKDIFSVINRLGKVI